MITDRTSADVLAAKEIVRTNHRIFGGGYDLTDEQIATLERGTLTINTLNRIEGKQAEIKTLINECGYYNTAEVTNRTWDYSDYFTKSDLERLVKNNSILRESFFVASDAPDNATARYHFEEINKLEKILVLLTEALAQLEANIRECDTFWCGEDDDN